jgi:hypothetical protein
MDLRLWRGELPYDELPDEIVLCHQFWALIDKLFKATLKKKREYGICIHTDRGEVDFAHRAIGDVASIEPRCGGRSSHRQYAGFIHTHLPIGNILVPGFSDFDFKGAIVDRDHVSLVYNGQEIFAIAVPYDWASPKNPGRFWAEAEDDMVEELGQASSVPEQCERLLRWDMKIARLLRMGLYMGKSQETLRRFPTNG